MEFLGLKSVFYSPDRSGQAVKTPCHSVVKFLNLIKLRQLKIRNVTKAIFPGPFRHSDGSP
jgi:hypothetical protein